MNPGRRPIRFMSMDAGKVASRAPTCIKATGSVASAGLDVSCWPTTPLNVMTVIAAIRNNA